MTAADPHAPQDDAEGQTTERESSRGNIDIDVLADRVYRLMMREIRLSRARGEDVGRR